jgi:5'-nucleotidase
MKNVLCLLLLANLVAGCPAGRPPDPARGAGDRVTITVLATNDLHGQLEPLVRYTREPTPRRYRVAGAVALAATLGSLRARDPGGTILLDAGDFMQGSLCSNRHEGRPIRELLGLLRYDAVAIGNHEFDFGPVGVPDRPGDPLGALKAWCAGAPFPVLSANLASADGTPLWRGLERSLLVERRGVKVGIVGLTTPLTRTTTMPALVRGLRFEPLLETATREARALRARGAAAVILLAHGDGECDGAEPSRCRGELFALLDRLEPGLVDAMVAGHSHQAIAVRYRDTLVSESCSRGLLIGRLELQVDRATRRVVAAGSRLLPPTRVCHDIFASSGSCVEPDRGGDPIVENPLLARQPELTAAARAILERARPPASDPVLRVVARSPRPLRHGLSGESEAGELFARALLRAVPDAEVAIFNAGSVRADLPAGPIRYADLFHAFPFDNQVATATLRGHELRELIETLLAHAYGVPLVAGLSLRLRCGPPSGPRYLLAALGDAEGQPLAPDRSYRVVLSDFLLTGGDGLGPLMATIPAARKQVSRRLVRDAIAQELGRHPLEARATTRSVIEDAPCRRRPRASAACE